MKVIPDPFGKFIYVNHQILIQSQNQLFPRRKNRRRDSNGLKIESVSHTAHFMGHRCAHMTFDANELEALLREKDQTPSTDDSSPNGTTPMSSSFDSSSLFFDNMALDPALGGAAIDTTNFAGYSDLAGAASFMGDTIHMHLDGARLWEAVAAGACTLREIGECFDSMQMCFTKGLGAPLGSIVVGSSAFIQRAKWSRKLLGGGMRSSGVISGPARVAIDDVLFGGRMRMAQHKARLPATRNLTLIR